MAQKLDTNGQISKLGAAAKMASEAAASTNVAERLGAVVLYAGMVDYLVIQAARLLEQIMLKAQLANGKPPAFRPNDDAYFYDKKASTGSILKGIRKLLPFTSLYPAAAKEAARITNLAERMIDTGFAFLDYRNPLMHQIGSPNRTFEEVLDLASRAVAAYEEFRQAHAAFFVAVGPYRFGKLELTFFYGPPSSAVTTEK